MSDTYCINCGSKIQKGLKYCPVCGSPVTQSSQKSNETIDAHSIPVPDIDLTNEPVPVQPDRNEQTQNLDLNSIRLSEPDIPSFQSTEEDAPEPTKIVNNSEERKPKHGRLYSAFIEDDDDYDDEEDDEEEEPKHRSHVGLIILLIVLIVALGALFYILRERPSFIFHSSSDAENTSTIEITPEPTSEATASAITTEETVSDGTIGSLTVEIDSINVRSEPDTSSTLVRTVNNGETLSVYETTENNDLTWYRIGENEWIADGGGWVSYTANGQ